MKTGIFVPIVTLTTAAGLAMASHVSTFDITSGDYVLTGFAAGGFPTAGPTVGTLSNITGTYALDIPPAGTVWDIWVEGNMAFDIDEDGTADFVQSIPSTFVETATSTGPATSFTDTVAVDDFTVDIGGGPVTISGLMALITIDVDGPYPGGSFGAAASMSVSLSGGDIMLFNSLLDALDNAGLDDDMVTAGFVGDFTVTLVPSPAPMALLGLGGLVAMRRRR